MRRIDMRSGRGQGLVALLAVLALAAGCGSDDTSGGNGADASGGGGGGGADKCTSNAGGNLGIDLKPVMDVAAQEKSQSTGATLQLSTGALALDATLDTVFTIRNTAQIGAARELRVEKLDLLYSKPSSANDSSDPFTCTVEIDGAEKPCAEAGVISVVPDGADAKFCTSGGVRTENLVVHVRFRKQPDNVVRKAVLRITAPGDERYSSSPFSTILTTKEGTPKLKLSPEVADFGIIKIGACGEKKVSMLNSGDAPVLVNRIEIAKTLPKPVSAEIEGKTYKGGETVTFDPPLEVPPQESIPIIVTICPTDPSGFLDVVKVFSNDGATACGADDSCKEGQCVSPAGGAKYCSAPQTAKLIANQAVPCLKVIPAKAVNFGFVPLGTAGTRKVRLESCGSATVEVTGLALSEDKSGVYKLDTSKVTSLGGKPVAADNVLAIKQGQAVEVNVDCLPETEYVDPGSGKPAPYTAKLGIADNTIETDKNLELSCWGTATNCPTAVASCQEGELVVPQTEVHLVGSQSFAGPNQKIVKYEWKVTKQPKGSEADHLFWPNANTADPQFGAKTKKKDFSGQEIEVVSINIAGEYVFELEVTDDAGNTSCQKAVLSLPVIPDEDIHVELLWDTPDDLDKKDTGMGAGADMDLHFAHSKASDTKICQDPPEMCGGQPCYCLGDLDKDGKVDPFFHQLYDCFWFNANPNWNNTDPSVDDNPGLDLDDTDGWGPENLNLKTAENGAYYTVGVHYWDAHGYGDSVATVRIYVLGQMVGEFISTTLTQCDMWWVKKIEWPAGTLTDIGGANGKITKKYFPKFAKALGAKCSD